MKKAVFLASLSVMSFNVLGMDPSLPIDSGQSSSVTRQVAQTTDNTETETAVERWEKIRSAKEEIRKTINQDWESRISFFGNIQCSLYPKEEMTIDTIRSLTPEHIRHELLQRGGYELPTAFIKSLSPETIQNIFSDLKRSSSLRLTAVIDSSLIDSKKILGFLFPRKHNSPLTNTQIQDLYNFAFSDVPNFLSSCTKKYPLHYTYEWLNGNKNILKHLIKLGMDVDQMDISDHSYTPLLKAIHDNKEDFVEFFVSHGADVNLAAGINTPLNLACKEGNDRIVKYLIEHGAEINRVFNDHPLFVACSNGHENIVKYLVECGADVNLQNLNEKTALWVAQQSAHESIAQYLRDHGAKE